MRGLWHFLLWHIMKCNNLDKCQVRQASQPATLGALCTVQAHLAALAPSLTSILPGALSCLSILPILTSLCSHAVAAASTFPLHTHLPATTLCYLSSLPHTDASYIDALKPPSYPSLLLPICPLLHSTTRIARGTIFPRGCSSHICSGYNAELMQEI